MNCGGARWSPDSGRPSGVVLWPVPTSGFSSQIPRLTDFLFFTTPCVNDHLLGDELRDDPALR